ncbi:hypothetical protein GCM10017673_41790 [Streptosporangium violaceochromogenes]|nr:hypothetical protein GCM10017673_41790 [Streptosporangium violaceochromogenes]
MAFGQTATPPHTKVQEDDGITESTAEQHDLALAAVQRLLKARGVRTRCLHRINLKLFGDGRPFPLGERRRYVPELVVHDGTGRADTVVSVDRNSGRYLVSRPSAGAESRAVEAGQPQVVADMVLTALSSAPTASPISQRPSAAQESPADDTQ